MRRIIIALALSALSFLDLVAASAPASAEITYPWCAQYRGGDRGGGRNCGFWTYEQCVASVSGNNGTCEINAMYRGPQPGMIPPPPTQSRERGYSTGGVY